MSNTSVVLNTSKILQSSDSSKILSSADVSQPDLSEVSHTTNIIVSLKSIVVSNSAKTEKS